MIYIDPSELRETSNLLKYLSDVVYKPLSGLETLTGADVMISPSKCFFSDGKPYTLPPPSNNEAIKWHIKLGAKLIQVKFGHDLPTSIMDDRLKDAQSRMLACGANAWQNELLFIGLLGLDSATGLATVNGQLTYGHKHMPWANIDAALLYWSDRGGYTHFLNSGRLVPEHFKNIQLLINLYTTKDGQVRKYYPRSPAFYHEVASDNEILKKWGVGQKLERIEDIRQMFMAIPDCRIGPEKATAILQYMEDNEIRQDWCGFIKLVNSEKLLEVSGIGKGILKAIKKGLYKTYKERNKE